MVLPRRQLLMVAVYFVASGVVSGVLAQPAQPGRQAAPMYDMKTEASFAGTVDAVENVTRPDLSGHRSLGGTHLILKTAAERLEVHLGPSAFLMDKKINILKGDTVEVLGSRLTIDGTQVLLAREIKKGDNTWMLRDASGRPMWSGSRR